MDMRWSAGSAGFRQVPFCGCLGCFCPGQVQPAHVGPVLNLLNRPDVVDPLFVPSGSEFPHAGRHLAQRPELVDQFFPLLHVM